ncbi:MAG: MBL fold metallo-hydrolase [Planctomycetaceae bacterium]
MTSERELTLLGTGTSMGVPMIGCHCPVCMSTDPRDQRTRTGVAVSTPQGNFLIDTSPELRLQLTREKIDLIEAVIYTHAHADHLLGVDDLRIFGYKRQAPVPLYCEAAVETTIRQTFPYAFTTDASENSRPNLEFRRIDTTPFTLLGEEIQPIRLVHGTLPVLGFRLGNVAFCTDCNSIPEESWPLLEGLDVLILDALYDDPHPTHFSVPEALEVIARVAPKQAYLTHVSHRLGYRETNARLPAGVQLAYDGLKIPYKSQQDS